VRTLAVACAAALAVLTPAICAAADLPAWLEQAARLPAATADAGADAVVLLDEVNVVVSDDGRITTRRNFAIRILTRAGAGAAVAREVYTTGSGNVKTIRGWLLVDGRTTELGRSATMDVALVDNDLYNESRVRVLAAPAGLVPGTIFGAETEVIERSVFTQFDWMLQQEWPVRTVRRSLTLPAGWDARAVTFNHAPLEAVRTGPSFVWSLQDVPALINEPFGPPISSVAPRLAVTYLPTRRGINSFDDWSSVSKWLATLADPQAAAHPALTAKTRELTAAAASELDRIRAVGRYVQSVQYLSIQTGLGRGGGYTPRAAIDVFTRNYGDCKDKANLMRTMLASIGVRAYIVTIYSGDPSYVRSEWPSPQQFNHAIIGIVVGAGTSGPAVLANGSLGRLLFFDPTDEQTPVGELPMHLQGSRALIVNADGGALVRMPDSKPEANPTTRRVDASVTFDGTLRATVRRSSAGDPASAERQLFRGLQKDQYVRVLEADVRRQIPGATLTLGEIGDDATTNRFELTMKLEALAYAQVLQGRLLIVRPPQTVRYDLPVLTAGFRRTPILLEPREERDVLELALPPGASVDEIPEPLTREAPFGSFSVRWQADDGKVIRLVSLRIQRSSIPPESYADAKAFFDAFREAEQQPVVLARK
jgi:transglutaminase-like putative cysteine protease